MHICIEQTVEFPEKLVFRGFFFHFYNEYETPYKNIYFWDVSYGSGKQKKLEKTSTKKSKTERFRAVFSGFFLPSSHFDKTFGHFLSFFYQIPTFFAKNLLTFAPWIIHIDTLQLKTSDKPRSKVEPY